jgi:hypothetical protein
MNFKSGWHIMLKVVPENRQGVSFSAINKTALLS